MGLLQNRLYVFCSFKTRNMKVNFLIASLVSSGLADGTDTSCPNEGWTYSTDVAKCVPRNGDVEITCNADNMVVTLKPEQIYVLMDNSHLNQASSAAIPGTCTASAEASTDGTYTVTIPLDDCGTVVTQADNTLTFTNYITGNDAALAIDGIIVTDPLQLDVACEYPDTFELTYGNITVEAGVHTMDSVSMEGTFTNEFTLTSYTNDARTQVTDGDNGITIGNKVFNRVDVNGTLPSNVDYVVTDCTAMGMLDGVVNRTLSYQIIRDGCMDNLLEATSTNMRGRGAQDEDVDFEFNGFTFSSTMSTLYLECTIVLCAIDTNGDFQDSTCGYQYGNDDCASFDATKTLDYTKAPALV